MIQMITYAKMLRDRYLSQKAQGMVEYALIIAFVIVVAAALSSDGGLTSAISGIFDKTATRVNNANTAAG